VFGARAPARFNVSPELEVELKAVFIGGFNAEAA
jgi:hypothetical protein